MITYKPLWETMKRRNMTQYRLRVTYGFGTSTLQKLRQNKSMNTSTIERLCEVLDCNVWDIMIYEKQEKL